MKFCIMKAAIKEYHEHLIFKKRAKKLTDREKDELLLVNQCHEIAEKVKKLRNDDKK